MGFREIKYIWLTLLISTQSAFAIYIDPEFRTSNHAIKFWLDNNKTPCTPTLGTPTPMIKDLAMLKRLWHQSSNRSRALIAQGSLNPSQRPTGIIGRLFGRNNVKIMGTDGPVRLEDLYVQIKAAEQRANSTLADPTQIEKIVDLALDWFRTLESVSNSRKLTVSQVAAIFGLRAMMTNPLIAALWAN